MARMDEHEKSITVGSIVIFCLLKEGNELSLFVDYIATDVKISLNDITGTAKYGKRKWKGQGMARRLLRLVQYIGSHEMGCISLTLISNMNSRSFYEKLGFAQKSFGELSQGIHKRIEQENLDQSGTLIPFVTEALSTIPPDDLIYLLTNLDNQLNQRTDKDKKGMIESCIMPKQEIVDHVFELWRRQEDSLLNHNTLKGSVDFSVLRRKISEGTVKHCSEVNYLLGIADFEISQLFNNLFISSFSGSQERNNQRGFEKIEILSITETLLKNISVSVICLDAKDKEDVSENKAFLSCFKCDFCEKALTVALIKGANNSQSTKAWLTTALFDIMQIVFISHHFGVNTKAYSYGENYGDVMAIASEYSRCSKLQNSRMEKGFCDRLKLDLELPETEQKKLHDNQLNWLHFVLEEGFSSILLLSHERPSGLQHCLERQMGRARFHGEDAQRFVEWKESRMKIEDLMYSYNNKNTETTLETYKTFYEENHPNDYFAKLISNGEQVIEAAPEPRVDVKKDITEYLG